MTPFNTFGEYMFDLLFAPLRKGKKSVNQFFIFFKVIGRIFDGMKADIFRVRNEANVVTASPIMLPVHGQDRDMPRLQGEDIEAYRTRLAMKGIISEWGGTKEGVVLAVKALGYTDVSVEPLYLTDSSRWAEAVVWFSGGSFVITDNDVILKEINKVKPGSAKLSIAHEEIFPGSLYCAGVLEVGRIREFRQV
ncbi:MAG TPA: hypothetical protein VN421_05920 [Pseudoflavonifractor sp.]|nr:hypothetical protein [Pseudoflavonifractor sp.]